MQKVEDSSPFIRFTKDPLTRGFSFVENSAEAGSARLRAAIGD